MNDNNFYITFYWMISRLGLKGADLTVFAIIYSFSQDGESEFSGSLNYLAKFSNYSRQTVINALSNLVEQDYIIKRQEVNNNMKFVTYQINLPVVKKFDGGSQKTLQGVVKKFDKGSQITLPNNKEITNNDNKNIEYIVDYLNKKAKTNYRYKSADTQKHIKARLNEGYTVDDFKTVIDKKVDEWSGTDMQKFIRPSTLFGSKFESYLNQPEKQVDFQKTPWKVGGKPNYDIDKITRDTLFNDDFDV